MDIHISDFGSILELSVTMNLAYVIVDYTNSFTKIIAEKICNFNDRIEQVCNLLVTDIDMLNICNIKPHQLDGKSTITQIEELKRKENSIKTQIEKAKNELFTDVAVLSNSRCFSFICFYLAVFCILALFLTPNLQDVPIIESFWLVYLCISIIFLLLLWICGESEKIVSFSSSLRYSSYSIIVILLASASIIYFFGNSIEINPTIHAIICIVTPVLSLFNFLVYTVIIILKSRHLSKLIKNKRDSFVADINKIKEQVKQHEGLNAISGQFAIKPSSNEDSTKIDNINQVEKNIVESSFDSIKNPEEHIYNLLQSESLTKTQIVKRTNIKQDKVRQCLRQLIAENKVTKDINNAITRYTILRA